jgi:hypothetical protein
VTLPSGKIVSTHTTAQPLDEVIEFVQVTSENRIKLDPKDQADVRDTIHSKAAFSLQENEPGIH